MGEIFLLRHLETNNNVKGLVSGRSESEIICNKLVGVEKIHLLHRVYSSPSERCRETIKLLFKQFGVVVETIFDDRLLERHMGVFEEQSKNELYETYPDYFILRDSRIRFNPLTTPPSGESFDDFSQRIESFYMECFSNNNFDTNILICSHNQTLKRLLLFKSQKNSVELFKIGDIPNGTIGKVSQGGEFVYC